MIALDRQRQRIDNMIPYLGVQAERKLVDATGDLVEMDRFHATIPFDDVHTHCILGLFFFGITCESGGGNSSVSLL